MRKIELTRALFGAALLLAPRPMLRTVHRVQVDRTSVTVARILGARQVTQAALSGVSPSPEVLAMGVWVDLAHAASALGLAAVDPTRAFAGLLNAGVAVAWARWGYADLVEGRVTPPAHDRHRDQLARWALVRVPGGNPLRRITTAERYSVPAPPPGS